MQGSYWLKIIFFSNHLLFLFSLISVVAKFFKMIFFNTRIYALVNFAMLIFKYSWGIYFYFWLCQLKMTFFLCIYQLKKLLNIFFELFMDSVHLTSIKNQLREAAYIPKETKHRKKIKKLAIQACNERTCMSRLSWQAQVASASMGPSIWRHLVDLS